MSMVAGAPSTAASALPSRADPSASTPIARSTGSVADSTMRSAWGRKVYAAGTPSGLTISTRFPSASQAMPSARSEPRASPSGRTWQAIRRLFAFRISLAACVNSSGFMILALAHAGEQGLDARASLDGGVSAEFQGGGETEPRPPRKLTADKSCRALEALQRLRGLLRASQTADVEAR